MKKPYQRCSKAAAVLLSTALSLLLFANVGTAASAQETAAPAGASSSSSAGPAAPAGTSSSSSAGSAAPSGAASSGKTTAGGTASSAASAPAGTPVLRTPRLGTPAPYTGTQRALADYVTAADSYVKIGGTPLADVTAVHYGDKIDLKLVWKFPNEAFTVRALDSFTYDLPDKIDWTYAGSAFSGSVYDNAGTAIGTFQIQGHTLSIAYTSDLAGDAVGELSLTGQIDSASMGNKDGGITSFTFPGVGAWTKTVDRDSSGDGVRVVKGAPAPVAGQPQQREFVLAVTSTGPSSNVVVSDTMGGSLSFVTGSLGIYTDAACTAAYTGTYAGTAFPVTVASMTNGQTLYLRYRVRVAQAAYTAAEPTAASLTNTAGVTSAAQTVPDTSAQTVQVDKTWVSKSGSANGTQSITWTVTVNAGEMLDIGGTTLSDVLGADMTAPDSVALEESADGVTWAASTVQPTWAQLARGTFTFPAGAKQYRFTYTTPVTQVPAVGGKNYTNTATVYPYGNADNGKTETATIGVGDAEQLVTKSCSPDSGSSRTIHWSASLLVPDTAQNGLTGAVFTDVLTSARDTGENTGTIAGGQAVVWGTGGDAVQLFSDAAHTVPYTGSVTKTQTADGFALTFHDTLAAGTRIYLAYSTTITYLDFTGSWNLYYNTASFRANETALQTADARYVYNKATQHLWKYFSDANGGRLNWHCTFWTVQADNLAAGVKPTITDTLPDNNTYIAGSLSAHDHTDNALVYSGVSAQVSEDGKTVVFTIDGDALTASKNGTVLELFYSTQIADLSKLQQTTTYTNTAYSTVGENSDQPSSADAKVEKPTVLDKSAAYTTVTAPFAAYSISVNPGAIDLDLTGDVLTLTDVMSSALDLQIDSLAIVKAGAQTSVPLSALAGEGYAFAYDAAARRLTLTAPDNTAFTLRYRAKVNLAVGADLTDANSANTVQLAGGASDSQDKTVQLGGKVLQAQATTVSSDHTVQIFKDDGGDASKPLSGANFRIDKLTFGPKDAKIWTTLSTESVKTLVSADTGYTPNFAGIKADNVYRIVETKAPDGYDLDTTPFYFVFRGQDGTDYSGVRVADGAKAYELHVFEDAQAYYTYYMSNTRTQTVAATVRKVWSDSSNSDGKRPGSVTLQLQKTVDGTTLDVLGRVLVLTADNALDDNTWTATFEGLPKNESGTQIVYTVREADTDANYTAKIDGLTVTNTRKPASSSTASSSSGTSGSASSSGTETETSGTASTSNAAAAANTSSPRTGDTTNVSLWMLALLAGAAGMGAVLVLKRHGNITQ